MLKALDELERAVGRVLEKTSRKAPDGPVSEGALSSTRSAAGEAKSGQASDYPERPNDEAAQLIRRALKRLKSL